MYWYVLYTKPRNEKRAAEDLEALGIEVYCPVITKIRQWSDRKKKVVVPLFTSYIFVKLPEKKRNSVFEVSAIVRYLFWLGKPAIVKDEEIAIIKEWLSEDLVSSANVEHLKPGDEVTIATGALKDKKAIIQEVGNKTMRLILPGMGCAVVVKTKDVIG